MAKFQLPPLKNENEFEEFVCDLFNAIENTESYKNIDFQLFGTRGQNQKGIDIFSPKTKTVIQCKLKSVRRKDNILQNELLTDIETDLIKSKDLNFEFERFIFVSTFRDDAVIQEFILSIKNQYSFAIYYWGWDSITRHVEENIEMLKKYFPKLIHENPKAKPDLPIDALGKDILKKNYVSYLIKKYGDWKQLELSRKGEKFNWASFNKHLMNKFRAPGVNFIHINYFDSLISYLQDRIDKTIFGKSRLGKGQRNYSSYEEHSSGIKE